MPGARRSPAQVNASPSLTADTATDYCLKMGLLEDGMSIVDMEKLCAPVRASFACNLSQAQRRGEACRRVRSVLAQRRARVPGPGARRPDPAPPQHLPRCALWLAMHAWGDADPGCYNEDRQQQLFGVFHATAESRTPF